MTAKPGDTPPPNPPVIEGAGGVVLNSAGNVLLIQHRNGTWVFPKGHLETDEDYLDTALREVSEEAGVDATCPNPEMTWTTHYLNPRGEHRHITWFLLNTRASYPVMREKLFPRGGFFPPQEALWKLSFEEDRSLLNTLLEQAGTS